VDFVFPLLFIHLQSSPLNRLQLNSSKTGILWLVTSRRLHQLPWNLVPVGSDCGSVYSRSKFRNSYWFWRLDAVPGHTISVDLVFGPASAPYNSVSRSVIQSLVTSLVLSHLDYGNATLAGILQHLLWRLQSVINAAARLVYSSSRFGHITPLLSQLHWLKVKERIDFEFAVFVYKCMHRTAPPYLANELADLQARCRLRSTSSSSLLISWPGHSPVNRQRLVISGDRVTRMERFASACHSCTFSHSIS